MHSWYFWRRSREWTYGYGLLWQLHALLSWPTKLCVVFFLAKFRANPPTLERLKSWITFHGTAALLWMGPEPSTPCTPVLGVEVKCKNFLAITVCLFKQCRVIPYKWISVSLAVFTLTEKLQINRILVCVLAIPLQGRDLFSLFSCHNWCVLLSVVDGWVMSLSEIFTAHRISIELETKNPIQSTSGTRHTFRWDLFCTRSPSQICIMYSMRGTVGLWMVLRGILINVSESSSRYYCLVSSACIGPLLLGHWFLSLPKTNHLTNLTH